MLQNTREPEPIDQVRQQLLTHPGSRDTWKKTFSGGDEDARDWYLVVEANRLLWRAKKPVEPTLSNDDHDWLTYETLFNLDRFRKTNQQCYLGQYRIALKNVRIFVAEKIDPAALDELRKAFFPDCVDSQQLIGRSAIDCPWQDRSQAKSASPGGSRKVECQPSSECAADRS